MSCEKKKKKKEEEEEEGILSSRSRSQCGLIIKI